MTDCSVRGMFTCKSINAFVLQSVLGSGALRWSAAWPQTSCALAERYQTLSNNHIHLPMCLCVSLSFSSSVRADGLPEGASHPAPPLHCRCVRSGLSPCELPSDPRLSMRELIMADGPRCKRRKQANPRRKNGKSRMGKCPCAERVRCANGCDVRGRERSYSVCAS